jgi:hypothetical protein
MMRLHESESDGTLREETIEVCHFGAVRDGSAIAADQRQLLSSQNSHTKESELSCVKDSKSPEKL